MIQPSTRQARPAARPVDYFERLRTPWWWYPVALAVAVLLGLEFALAISGWIAWVPFVLLVPCCLLVVWRLSSASITLAAGTLEAGDRSLAASAVEQAIDLSPTELRRLVGRHSDPLAFTFIRSWVGPGVQLVLHPPTGADANPSDTYPADTEPVGTEAAGSSPADTYPEGTDPADTYPEGTDPADTYPADEAVAVSTRYPVPYWVLSTRHPDRLLAALRSAAAGAPEPTRDKEQS